MTTAQVQLQEVLSDLGLPSDARGVLPGQALARAVELGFVDAAPLKIPETNIQPASIDLRLGETAYRIRSSFLPDRRPVEAKLKEFVIDEVDISAGGILDTKRPYLIPLAERISLPAGIRGRTNPKSSTGRLDVFTRVITDGGHGFDQIRSGYSGPLYVEVVPLSFTVRVTEGLPLNQLRLSIGRSGLSDEEVVAAHEDAPLLFRNGRPVEPSKLPVGDGLFLSLDLHGGRDRRVGYRAKEHAPVIDMARSDPYSWETFWDPVYREEEADRIILDPGRFYLLLSKEAVRIPPDHAAEMAAYDPTSGELRTHYAGFFDPGFGFDVHDHLLGSRAALEVRAHDVPFMIEDGQRVCKLSFERMAAKPALLYGEQVGSSYQGQMDTLGKHFRGPRPAGRRPSASGPGDQTLPFDDA